MNESGKKTSRGWEFRDFYTFRVVSHSPTDLAKVRDDYMGAFKPPVAGEPHPSGLGVVGTGSNPAPSANSGITIKIAATHAGLVTRNNGFYMPDKVKNGVASWTEHYPKPIQIHHNESPGDSQDPIGRVIAARYVDTTDPVTAQFQNSVLRDSYNNDVGRADRKFWDRFVSEKTSFIEKLNMMRMMDSVLQDSSYHGVGYIELTANITDPDAIPKILDGRYITGSVGAVSDKAVCSVCNTDWLEEEHCGHRPGRIYDGKKCVVVAGNLEYDEYSFVNTPADRHSGILQIQNSVDTNARDGAVRFFPVFGDTKEDATSMKETTTTAQVQDSVSETQIPTPTEPVTPVVTDEAAAAAQLIDLQATPVNQLETLLDKLLTGNKLSDEETDALYELQLSEMDKEVIEDSKLPAAKRKKLAASAFCGPQKTFLVTDCAHATAAEKLLAKYKGPGDVANIAGAIARKKKAFGCDAAQVQNSVKDNVQEITQVQEVVTPPAEHEFNFASKFVGEITDQVKLELSTTFLKQMLEKFGKDALQSAAVSLELGADPAELQTLVDEVAKNEEIIGQLRDRVNALQRELKASYDDMVQVEDELIAAKDSIRKSKLKHVETLHQLGGTLTDAVKGELNVLSDALLDNELASLATKVDINKITDKLNSGLSRTPEEEVNVPAGLTEPSAETKPINKPTYATQRMVDQVYDQIYLREGNPARAKAYYDDMVKQGLAAPKK